MERKLYTIQEVTDLINNNHNLILTADEKTLDQLPKGNWIGGTIPYFMDKEGGTKSKNKIFVDDFTDVATNSKITTYNKDNIKNIATDGFENGFTMLIIPAGSETHVNFSLDSFHFNDIFKNPIVGYISGFDLDEIATAKAYAYTGNNNLKTNDLATAFHFELPVTKIASVDIINIFTENEKTPKITFPKKGFVQKNCFVDGKEVNFAEYLKQNDINIQLPIIENQNGALINRSIMRIIEETNETEFYAPIFDNVEYSLSEHIDNYTGKFNTSIAEIETTENIKYSCNCILNYLYGELEGKKIALTGATTFGEIAYQLLNQTQIYLKIENI